MGTVDGGDDAAGMYQTHQTRTHQQIFIISEDVGTNTTSRIVLFPLRILRVGY